jgi:hypothetical protein
VVVSNGIAHLENVAIVKRVQAGSSGSASQRSSSFFALG